MNTYATLKEIRENIGLTSSETSDDSLLLRQLNAASREIDRAANRFFFSKNATFIFDGTSAERLVVPDLLSVSTLKGDLDGDGAFDDVTLTEGTDFRLRPNNKFPKTEIELISTRSYSFPTSKASIELVGVAGYGDGESADPWSTAVASNTATTSDASTKTVSVSDGDDFSVGETLLLDGSEQVYIESIATNDLTVERAVNGTTGATHAGVTIQRAKYPDNIRQFTLELALIFFSNRDAGGEQSERIGDFSYSLFPNAQKRIETVVFNFRRRPFGTIQL